MRGKIIQLAVGLPQEYPEETLGGLAQKAWTTGFYKSPVTGRVPLGLLGLEGDGQADLVHHGGLDKAVLCYGASHYKRWREELRERPEVSAAIDIPRFGPGAFGENLTIKGLTEEDVCLGDIYHVGTATVQVSQPRQPCWKLARRWKLPSLTAWAIQTGRMGWYLRILDEGEIGRGDEMILVDRSLPEWSVRRLNHLFYFQKSDLTSAAFLANCRELAQPWREEFQKRLENERASEGEL